MAVELPMAGEREQYTFDRVVRMVLSAAVVVGALLLLRYLSDVLLPFAVAVVLAYLLNPLVTLLERRTGRRGLAVGIALGGLGIVGVALAALIMPLFAAQVDRFGRNLAKLRLDLAPAAVPAPDESDPPAGAGDPSKDGDPADEKTSLGWQELNEGWRTFRANAATSSRAQRFAALREHVAGTVIGGVVEGAIDFTQSDEFRNVVLDAAKHLAVGGWTVVSFALNLILGLAVLIIVLLYLVFLLMDFPQYSSRWPMFLPPQYRKSIVEFYEQFNLAMRRYLRGQAVVALSVGALFSLGFTLIELPMALPFGLFIGLLNMVPYLQTVGLVPGVMLAGLRAIEGDSSFAVSVGLVLAVFVVIQIIQDALLAPRIMGRATGLSPVAILLGVFVWGKLLGFLGLLLAIPLTCLGIAYYRRYVLLHAPDEASPAAPQSAAR